jgi:N-acyl-D-aspartate/D-glutamate deacylase
MGQAEAIPERWREILDAVVKGRADGARLYPQIHGRPVSSLMGFETTLHPFKWKPTFAAMDSLPYPEKLHRLRDPDVRARILREENDTDDPYASALSFRADRIYPLGETPDYEPDNSVSVAAIAASRGLTAHEVMYDMMLEQDGRNLLQYIVFGYGYGNAEPTREMILFPDSIVGGSDAGAHCGAICDASTPTTMLTNWTRDRTRGPRIPLETVVAKQSRLTARAFGLRDRGVIQPGYRADLNLIDYDNLRVHTPEMTYDLHEAGGRLLQRAEGYIATLCAGEVILDSGVPTEARPGRLVRRR